MTRHELEAWSAKTLADDCAELLEAFMRRRRRRLSAKDVHEIARRMRALGVQAVAIAPASEEAA